MKECKIENCTRLLTPKSAKGMCEKHYKRLVKGLDPNELTDYDERPHVERENHLEVPLGRGAKDGYAIVDKDLLKVTEYKWHLTNRKRGRTHNYVATGVRQPDGTTKELKLHHLVVGKPPRGRVVDHISGNKLDNRRSNLRFVTRQQNAFNHTVYGNNTSGYIGAYLHKPSGGWMSKIGHNGKLVHIGTFRTAEEAAKARDKVAIELHGEFAKLNFPL